MTLPEGYEGDDDVCPRCDGRGEMNVCIDDMCHGQEECIHGDGMLICRLCRGTGVWSPPPEKQPSQAPAEPPTP